MPRARFVTGPQSDPEAPPVTAPGGTVHTKHTLSYLGPWAAPGLCQCCSELAGKPSVACCQDTCEDCVALNASYVREYTKAVNARGGVLTVDLQLLRNGSMDAQQVATLREAWRSLK